MGSEWCRGLVKFGFWVAHCNNSKRVPSRQGPQELMKHKETHTRPTSTSRTNSFHIPSARTKNKRSPVDCATYSSQASSLLGQRWANPYMHKPPLETTSDWFSCKGTRAWLVEVFVLPEPSAEGLPPAPLRRLAGNSCFTLRLGAAGVILWKPCLPRPRHLGPVLGECWIC